MPNSQPDSQSSKNAPRLGASRPPEGPRNRADKVQREEMSRHDREVRLTKAILMGAAGLVALVLLILGFGYWREYVARSSDAVATVGTQKITLEDYASRLDFRRIASEQQIQMLQTQYQSVSGNQQLADLFNQQLQQLQFGMALLPEQTLDQMVAEEIVRQEAARRGIKASPEEIDGQNSADLHRAGRRGTHRGSRAARGDACSRGHSGRGHRFPGQLLGVPDQLMV